MAKFANTYGVRKIVYKKNCRCFCPIGEAEYTNEFTVTMEPGDTIPDYCEIDKFIQECIEGESMVIEEAACTLKRKIVEYVHPNWIMVESKVQDAVHGDVEVMV